MKNKIEHYNHLITLAYNEAVALLQVRYGKSKDDYFREKSYERFLKKEIKSITKGKFSRTSEGLYCHHIAEDKYLNLTDADYIFKNKYSFELQRKEQLVFCDLFEHLILHALIANETNGNYGLPGYNTYLYPMILEWYIGQEKPQGKEWMKKCFERAFLDPIETKTLLQKINLILPAQHQKKGDIVYISAEERYKRFIERKAEWEKEKAEWQKREELRKKKEIRQRTEEFYQTYPNFKIININFDTPRNKVISMLYDLKYKDSFKSKKELDLTMKSIIKDDLLNELYWIIS